MNSGKGGESHIPVKEILTQVREKRYKNCGTLLILWWPWDVLHLNDSRAYVKILKINETATLGTQFSH